MKSSSLFIRIVFLILLIFIVPAGIYINYKIKDVTNQTYAQLAGELVTHLENEEQSIKDTGIINAFIISDNKEIQNALITNNRQKAITALQTISKKFKKSTRIKDLKIHIHTADIRAFVRSWKLDEYGDKLGDFRNTIVRVKETEKPIFAYEVGRMGLTLRSIVPILDNDNYIGSLEFIENFHNASKSFVTKGNQHLLLMNKSLLDTAADLKSAPDVGPYKLSLKPLNEDFVKAAQKLDFEKLRTDKIILTDEYLFTYKEIKDMENTEVGIHLMAMPINEVKAAIENVKSSLLIMIGIIVGSFLFVLALLILLNLESIAKIIERVSAKKVNQ